MCAFYVVTGVVGLLFFIPQIQQDKVVASILVSTCRGLSSIFKLNLGASFDIEQVENESENIKRFYQSKGFPHIVVKNIVNDLKK